MEAQKSHIDSNFNKSEKHNLQTKQSKTKALVHHHCPLAKQNLSLMHPKNLDLAQEGGGGRTATERSESMI